MQLKKEHPSDYRKLLELFPWAEAQVFRFERGDYNHKEKGDGGEEER